MPSIPVISGSIRACEIISSLQIKNRQRDEHVAKIARVLFGITAWVSCIGLTTALNITATPAVCIFATTLLVSLVAMFRLTVFLTMLRENKTAPQASVDILDRWVGHFTATLITTIMVNMVNRMVEELVRKAFRQTA